MPFDFPAAPIDGQIYSPSGGPDYIFRTASGAWEIQTSGSNSAFVAKAGDTMSGDLSIVKDSGALNFDGPSQSQLLAKRNGSSRWLMQMPDGGAAADFRIYRYDDGGTIVTPPALQINRTNGMVSLASGLNAFYSTANIATGARPAAAMTSADVAADAAYLTFRREARFSVNLGLDTDNQFKIGGGSLGAVAWKMFHDGNFPAANNYFKHPSGLMFVFGNGNVGINGWLTFPVAFPVGCNGAVVCPIASQADTILHTSHVQTVEPTRMFVQNRYAANGGTVAGAASAFNYIAWGA